MPSHYRLFFTKNYQFVLTMSHFEFLGSYRDRRKQSKMLQKVRTTAIALRVRISANYKYGYKRKRISHIDLATAKSQFLKKSLLQSKIEYSIQPSKLNSRLKRIDGAVDTIIAYATLTRYKLDYESVLKQQKNIEVLR